MKYELVLGLEIHIQIQSKTGMFCNCARSSIDSQPNTHACPVCLGLPGSLPVPNKDAIIKGMKMAYVCGSYLSNTIIFERKNYFYPDLPKGYQLTTPHYPLSKGGEYTVLFPINNTKIAWREIHIEEDTAKSIHGTSQTFLDFNKSGAPLLELVTEPEFATVEDAIEFAKEIQAIARFIKVSDADMEKGQMRLEANISLRKKGQKELPKYRVELKNINSFTFMKKALEAEIKRQEQALDSKETLIQETRGFVEGNVSTVSQRSKEEAHDYRYFPDPDIPPIIFSDKELDYCKKSVTQTPQSFIQKMQASSVPVPSIKTLFFNKEKREYLEQTLSINSNEKVLVKSVVNTIINTQSLKASPKQLIQNMSNTTKNVFTNEKELDALVQKAIKNNPQAASDYRLGKNQALGVLIGAVMKETKGKADAKTVQNLLIENIGK